MVPSRFMKNAKEALRDIVISEDVSRPISKGASFLDRFMKSAAVLVQDQPCHSVHIRMSNSFLKRRECRTEEKEDNITALHGGGGSLHSKRYPCAYFKREDKAHPAEYDIYMDEILLN